MNFLLWQNEVLFLKADIGLPFATIIKIFSPFDHWKGSRSCFSILVGEVLIWKLAAKLRLWTVVLHVEHFVTVVCKKLWPLFGMDPILWLKITSPKVPHSRRYGVFLVITIIRTKPGNIDQLILLVFSEFKKWRAKSISSFWYSAYVTFCKDLKVQTQKIL